MGSKGIELAMILVLLVMLYNGAKAQSGCSRVLMGLTPCLNYVTGNSSTPSSSCCSQLATVVQSQPQCLCALLNSGGSSLGFNINQTLALSLPGACNVQTPLVSSCNAAANGPSSSPVSPPSDSSDDTPETTNTPSVPSIPTGTGSKTVPATDGTSDAACITTQFHLTLFVSFVALYASTAVRF